MKNAAKLGFVLVGLFSSTAGLSQQPSLQFEGPSARELYIGCSLVVRGDELDRPLDTGRAPRKHSAATCMLETSYQLTFFSRKPEGFCPPSNASFDGNPNREMAGIFVQWFERYARRAAPFKGQTTMLLALKEKWPCK
jgi:hypothetical protein